MWKQRAVYVVPITIAATGIKLKSVSSSVQRFRCTSSRMNKCIRLPYLIHGNSPHVLTYYYITTPQCLFLDRYQHYVIVVVRLLLLLLLLLLPLIIIIIIIII